MNIYRVNKGSDYEAFILAKSNTNAMSYYNTEVGQGDFKVGRNRVELVAPHVAGRIKLLDEDNREISLFKYAKELEDNDPMVLSMIDC